MSFESIFSPDFYGFAAAVLTTVAFLPQLLKTWRTKSAEDVSFSMLILFLTGVLCWIIYGVYITSIPVILANVLTFILNASILFLKIRYRV